MHCPVWGEEIVEDSSREDGRRSEARRTFRARKDARVGAITRTIEEVFDLPEGSVAICTPEQKAFRTDALISTVRKRWKYE